MIDSLIVMRIIFIHGNDTLHWSYGWAPWLKKSVEELGIASVFETFPDSIIARKKYWLRFLKQTLAAGKEDILVGHSSGALAAMRYAEDTKIRGSILISPSYTDLGSELEKQSGYFDGPWQWEKIKSNNSFIGLFFSDNDPYIPKEEFLHIRSRLDPDTFRFKDRGHFMDEEFSELLDYLKKKVRV